MKKKQLFNLTVLTLVANLTELYDCDKKCTSENVRQIETILVHLFDRLKRVTDNDWIEQLKPIEDRLMHVHDEVVTFYSHSDAESNERQENTVPNCHTNSSDSKKSQMRIQMRIIKVMSTNRIW